MSTFRVLELGSTGDVKTFDGSEHAAPSPVGVARWIDLAASDEESLELLRARFDFHPLAIEDCAHLDQRPKLEEYRGHLFPVSGDAGVHEPRRPRRGTGSTRGSRLHR
jgi:magnesium transporter